MTKWLAEFPKKSTKKTYLAGVRRFLSCTYGDVFELSKSEELAQKYMEECESGRDYFKDLTNFALFLNDRPPISAKTYLNVAKTFIEFSLDIELSRKQMKTLKKKLPNGKLAATVEGDLTRERLRRILAHCDVKGAHYSCSCQVVVFASERHYK